MSYLQAEHKHTEKESSEAFGACVICARQVIKDKDVLIAALRRKVEESDSIKEKLRPLWNGLSELLSDDDKEALEFADALRSGKVGK